MEAGQGGAKTTKDSMGMTAAVQTLLANEMKKYLQENGDTKGAEDMKSKTIKYVCIAVLGTSGVSSQVSCRNKWKAVKDWLNAYSALMHHVSKSGKGAKRRDQSWTDWVHELREEYKEAMAQNMEAPIPDETLRELEEKAVFIDEVLATKIDEDLLADLYEKKGGESTGQWAYSCGPTT